MVFGVELLENPKVVGAFYGVISLALVPKGRWMTTSGL